MQITTSNRLFWGYILVIGSAILWGSEGIMAKICYAGGFEVPDLLFFRYLSAVPIFALVVKLKGLKIKLERQYLKLTMLYGLASVLGVGSLYLSLDILPATLGILFFYAYPTMLSLAYMALGKNSLGWARILALIISAGGLVLLYWSSGNYISPLGVGFALMAAIMQVARLGLTDILIKKVDVWNFNLFGALFTSLGFGLVFLYFIIRGDYPEYGAMITTSAWLALLFLGVVVTVLGFLSMALGIKIIGAVDTSLMLLLEPPVTALLAFIVFGDILSFWQICGGLMILFAVALPLLYSKFKTSKGLIES